MVHTELSTLNFYKSNELTHKKTVTVASLVGEIRHTLSQNTIMNVALLNCIGITYDYANLFNRLADLIDPTCKPVEAGNNIVCSECGADLYDDDLYCPHCGARVVRDDG